MALYEELIDEFASSSLENLDVVEPLLRGLQRRGSATSGEYSSIFRAIHTIQGSAGFIGLEGLQRLALASETLLRRLREGALDYQPSVAETLLEAVEGLRSMLREPEDPTRFPEATFEELARLTTGDRAETENETDEESLRLRFGEVAVDLGFLSDSDVEQLLESQGQSAERRSLGALGRELGLLDEAAIKTIAAEQTLRLLLSGHKLSIPGLTGARDASAAEPVAPRPAPRPRPRFSQPAETSVVDAKAIEHGIDLAAEIDRMRREIEDRLDEPTLDSVCVLLDRLRALGRELRLGLVDARTGTLADLFWSVERTANAVAEEAALELESHFSGEALEIEHARVRELREPLERLTEQALSHVAPGSKVRLELHACRGVDQMTLEFECVGQVTGRGSSSFEAVREPFERLGLGFEANERQGRRAVRIGIPL